MIGYTKSQIVVCLAYEANFVYFCLQKIMKIIGDIYVPLLQHQHTVTLVAYEVNRFIHLEHVLSIEINTVCVDSPST